MHTLKPHHHCSDRNTLHTLTAKGGAALAAAVASDGTITVTGQTITVTGQTIIVTGQTITVTGQTIIVTGQTITQITGQTHGRLY